jgi:shikimate 5-dehydrogenase
MLVSQGARSFELFTGKRAPFRVMKNAVENAMKFVK